MTTPRTCPSCGATVAAGERFCANCGARQADQTTPPGGQPAVEPTIVLPPLPTRPETDPAPGPYDAPPPPTLPTGGEPLRLPNDSGAPPPQARRGLPVWAILLLSLAGLCAIGCVATFVFINVIGQRVAEELPGAIDELSTAVVATAEAESGLIIPTLETGAGEQAATPEGAVGGAVGGVAGGAAGTVGGAASGSVEQSQTAEAELAATAASLEATAELDALFSGANQLFADEFVDNRNNWFQGVFEEIETDVIEDGVFKVIWAANGSSYELYEVQELTNFIAEVDCLIASGGTEGSCGLVFGQQDNVGFYKFEVFEDYFRLFIVQGEGEPPLLAEGDPSGIVLPGDWNRLRVIKQGDRIRLFINETPIADVQDSTFPTGKVGVSTNSYRESSGVEVHFDNFVVWELP